jgi:CheY-like chemotaxis protein
MSVDFESDAVMEAWLDATAPGCVLVVSENEVIRTGVRLLLQRNRYEAAEARSEDEALRLCVEWFPDLVIVDLPDPAAPRLLEEIRGEPGCATTLALRLTADCEGGASGTARFDGCLVKPADPQRILAEVVRLLEQRFGPGRRMAPLEGPRAAELVTLETPFPARTRVAAVPGNVHVLANLLEGLRAMGIRHGQLPDGGDIVVEYVCTVAQAFEMGSDAEALARALEDAFPWLAHRPEALRSRIERLRGFVPYRRTG